MGEAILAGLVHGAFFDPEAVIVANPGEQRRRELSENYGVDCVADGAKINNPDTVILAIKPARLREVSHQLSAAWEIAPKRVVSIAAGIPSSVIQDLFPNSVVIRVMPNVALAVGAGMTEVAMTADTPIKEAELVCELFSMMGEAVIVDEGLIDIATSVSGSGPAYFALFAEELAKAAAQAGLDAQLASLLARQTLIGAARYLELNDANAEELRKVVTSPNGTTQAALESFFADDLGSILSNAVQACIHRAKELAC
jgi:pyrroline-5-carboxylate reductase